MIKLRGLQDHTLTDTCLAPALHTLQKQRGWVNSGAKVLNMLTDMVEAIK